MRNQATIHPGNFECFLETYEECLKEACEQHPEMYRWYGGTDEQKDEALKICIEGNVQHGIKGMRKAIEQGTFNKDSIAFRATCKKLGISHTYKAIMEFIS